MHTRTPVPLAPLHRRSWRTLWRRCSCGLPEPCVDRVTTPAPPPPPSPPHPARGRATPHVVRSLDLTPGPVADHTALALLTEARIPPVRPHTRLTRQIRHPAHGRSEKHLVGTPRQTGLPQPPGGGAAKRAGQWLARDGNGVDGHEAGRAGNLTPAQAERAAHAEQHRATRQRTTPFGLAGRPRTANRSESGFAL